MKKLFSISYTQWGFNLSMLLLRLSFGAIILFNHGLPKLMQFSTLQNNFYNLLGFGTRVSLMLAIFAEVFCSLFLIMGLFTRIAIIPLILTMLVVVFGYDAGKPFLESEISLLYVAVFITIFICGPGTYSVDKMIND